MQDESQFRRDLRHRSTDAEVALWSLLRNRRLGGAKFRRQHPIPPYVLDFYCSAARLAIELDGGQHYGDAGKRWDATRDRLLGGLGIRVLRFSNLEVSGDLERVAQVILSAVG
jgi:very-short-patch-repair endonuclease